MTHFSWVAQFDFRDNLGRIEPSESNMYLVGLALRWIKIRVQPKFLLAKPKETRFVVQIGLALRVQGLVGWVEYIPWAILDQTEIEYESLKASALSCWSWTNIRSSKSNHTYYLQDTSVFEVWTEVSLNFVNSEYDTNGIPSFPCPNRTKDMLWLMKTMILFVSSTENVSVLKFTRIYFFKKKKKCLFQSFADFLSD